MLQGTHAGTQSARRTVDLDDGLQPAICHDYRITTWLLIIMVCMTERLY